MIVECFIDQYLSKKDYIGILIFKMEDIEQKQDVDVYVSVGLNDDALISSNLRENGYTNIHSFVESLEHVNQFVIELMKTNLLWMREDNKGYFNLDEISKFKEFLVDTESKTLLDNMLHFREELDMKYYVTLSKEIQYFPTDIDLFRNVDSIKMLDCGDFIGDTVKNLMRYSTQENLAIDSIVSFEADTSKIEKLKNEVCKQKNTHPETNFLVYPAGVWSENTILNFSNDGNSASAVCDASDEGCIQVPVFTLDFTLQGMKPNYIKMDIEGAEQRAIRGARKIIEEYSPVLAICLYHNPKDLWEIPLLIHEINPNYDMYIRVYGYLGLETVLYCVPK